MGDLFSQGEIAEVVENIGAGELTLDQALVLFETIYMPSRNFSEKTRVSYKTDLTQLVTFLKSCGVSRVEQVELSHLHAFLADLDAKGLTGVTRSRKVASVRVLFAYLLKDRLIARNPAHELIPPKREEKDPRYLTQQEYQALLSACSADPRDHAIIQLLLQTGIRLSEIARLTLDDIELPTHINHDPANTGSLYIHGKGRKERALPLNYKACQALKTWLPVRQKIASPALFVTQFMEPMKDRAFQDVVAKYLGAAGIKGASVHSLRHTFGTHHVMKGTDLKTIQAILGHEELRSTEIYISLAKGAMKRQLQDHAL